MTREEIVEALRIHTNDHLGCQDCPARNISTCFEVLVDETISLLEQDTYKATTGETPEANK